MKDTQERRCKECGGATHEIHLIDRQGPWFPESGVEYSLPDAQRSGWTGRYPVAGKVLAFLCDGCGQISLFAKSGPAK
jgi:hypothetical protein